MKLLFKQRFFSWFDSYDVFDSFGNTVFTVKGEFAWGHCLRIYDACGNDVGLLQEKIFTLLPKYEMYSNGYYIGCISKEFRLFSNAYNIDYNGWHVEGNFLEWDYQIYDGSGRPIADISKELFKWTDTYTIDVENPDDALCALMVVLAIDAEKCSRDDD